MSSQIVEDCRSISQIELSATEFRDDDKIIISQRENISVDFLSKQAEISTFKSYLCSFVEGSAEDKCGELSTRLVREHMNPLSDLIYQNRKNILSIRNKIPNQTWNIDNELADKQFVNYSIATNTSYFRGTYSSSEELANVSAYNNDYAFISSQVCAEIYRYDRYKYFNNALCSQGWDFEFTVNNSTFTSKQWNSLNSGITSALVEKLKNINFETWKFYVRGQEPCEKQVCVGSLMI